MKHLKIDSLKGLAEYILENSLEQFCLFQMNLFEESGKGIFPELDALPEDQKLALAIHEQSQMLKAIVDDHIIDKIKIDVNKFEKELEDSFFESFHYDAEAFDIVVKTQRNPSYSS